MQKDPSDKSLIVFESDQLQRLFDALHSRGCSIIGPTVRDDAVVLDVISSPGDLPAGHTCERGKATCRLKSRSDDAFFGVTVGPHSWKRYLHVPVLRLWEMTRDQNEIKIPAAPHPPLLQAFLGVRSCDLHAILILDRILANGDYVDSAYKARRDSTVIIAVNCTEADGTCFCASMGTGPKAESGFDLALTEVLQGDRHFFIAESGTNLGKEILSDVGSTDADEGERIAAVEGMARAAGRMGRQVDLDSIRDLLVRNPGHPRWDEVATRCMTCGNCTMVCPTCFCTTVEDSTGLTGARAERCRLWDSCFTLEFSYIHGGSVRSSPKSRFRQWMTHKFATWIDQLGGSGCVGCGRCIAWCPVGIDITEEIAAIRSGTAAGKPHPTVKETPHGNA